MEKSNLSITLYDGLSTFDWKTGGCDEIKRLGRLGKVVKSESSSLYVKNRYLNVLSGSEIDDALNTDATARRILAKKLEIQRGERVGIRLNINVKKATGICVHSIHEGRVSDGYKEGKGFWGGNVISYKQTIELENAYFNVHQKGRNDIATGICSKFPMASVDGEWVSFNDDASFDGIEISFQPMSTHLFVDGKGRAIWFAEKVTLLGNRAYARGLIAYHTTKSAPEKIGDAKSFAKIYKK